MILLALVPLLAQADLYRWVDPASGSIKFSSSPPPWMESEPQRGRRAPAVEVIPYRGASPSLPIARNAEPLAAARDAKSPAASTPAGSTSAESPAGIAALEGQWRALLKTFSLITDRSDLSQSAPALRQQLQSYEAISAELTRLDPAGVGRRRAEESVQLERVRKALEAQFGNRIAPEAK